jgi:hypothetical protein
MSLIVKALTIYFTFQSFLFHDAQKKHGYKSPRKAYGAAKYNNLLVEVEIVPRW